MSARLETYACWSLGPREKYEDACAVIELGFFDDPVQLFVLADGVGGEAGGEIASRLACTTILDSLVHTFLWARAVSPWFVLDALGQACELANSVVLLEAHERDLEGMATTVVVVVAAKGYLTVGWAGDSRLYLVRDQNICCVTRDHSEAERIMNEDGLQLDEVDDQASHTIHRCFGRSGVEIESRIIRLMDGDKVILCSDGLTDAVDDTSIAHVAMDNQLPQIASELVKAALMNFTGDNTTVLVGEYRNPQQSSTPTRTTLMTSYPGELAHVLRNVGRLDNGR